MSQCDGLLFETGEASVERGVVVDGVVAHFADQPAAVHGELFEPGEHWQDEVGIEAGTLVVLVVLVVVAFIVLVVKQQQRRGRRRRQGRRMVVVVVVVLTEEASQSRPAVQGRAVAAAAASALREVVSFGCPGSVCPHVAGDDARYAQLEARVDARRVIANAACARASVVGLIVLSLVVVRHSELLNGCSCCFFFFDGRLTVST